MTSPCAGAGVYGWTITRGMGHGEWGKAWDDLISYKRVYGLIRYSIFNIQYGVFSYEVLYDKFEMATSLDP
jgi:hypothetical protein